MDDRGTPTLASDRPLAMTRRTFVGFVMGVAICEALALPERA
jgi:hypothetical protein